MWHREWVNGTLIDHQLQIPSETKLQESGGEKLYAKNSTFTAGKTKEPEETTQFVWDFPCMYVALRNGKCW